MRWGEVLCKNLKNLMKKPWLSFLTKGWRAGGEGKVEAEEFH